MVEQNLYCCCCCCYYSKYYDYYFFNYTIISISITSCSFQWLLININIKIIISSIIFWGYSTDNLEQWLRAYCFWVLTMATSGLGFVRVLFKEPENISPSLRSYIITQFSIIYNDQTTLTNTCWISSTAANKEFDKTLIILHKAIRKQELYKKTANCKRGHP